MTILYTQNSSHIGEGIEDSILVNTEHFSDGEFLPQLPVSVRDQQIALIASTNYPTDNIWELYLIVDALKRHSAAKINVIIPYFGYARQDRISTPYTPIGSKVFIDCLQAVGATRIIAFDLHAMQEQGFANIPFDIINQRQIFTTIFKKMYEKYDSDLMIVSPDFGAVTRNRLFLELMDDGAKMAVINKDRRVANSIHGMELVGNVDGYHVVMFDDMIDTAGTVCKGAKMLIEKGAQSVQCIITHPLLSGAALKNLSKDEAITELWCSNSIDHGDKLKDFDSIKIFDMTPLVQEIIYRLSTGGSISKITM